MKLKEMSFQYREGAKACRARANELKEALWQCTGETEKMLLRRRIAILTRMANEAAATAKYLYNYYGGRDENDYDGSGKVSGAQAAREAHGRDRAGKNERIAPRHGGGFDAEAKAACTYVLHRAEAHAAYRRGAGA